MKKTRTAVFILMMFMATLAFTACGSGGGGEGGGNPTDATLLAIQVTPTNPSIAMGTSENYTATGIYSDSSKKDLTTEVTWTSLDESVATISNTIDTEGVATGHAVGVTSITATDSASGINGATGLIVTSAELVSIEVTPTNPSIANGTSQRFIATGTFTDNTTQDITTQVTWYSFDETVAQQSNDLGTEGLATSVAEGTTTITATDSATGISGSTDLEVTAAELSSIEVNPIAPSIANGTTQQFTATGVYTDSTTQNLTTQVIWTSLDETVSTISNISFTEGLATSEGEGTTTITATDAASGVSGSTELTVTAAALVSIEMVPADSSIALGTTREFTATGTFTDSTTQNITKQVTWGSSNEAVATTSNAWNTEGLATSVAEGTTTITATDSATGISNSTGLTVTAAELVSITVTPADTAIAQGAQLQFTATGTYTDWTTQVLTSQVTWSSSDETVATQSNALDSEGLATGVGEGNATISATDPTTSISGSTGLTGVIPPLAPSGLSGQVTGAHTYTLSWTDNSDDEDSFEIYKGQRTQNPYTLKYYCGYQSLVGSVGANVTTFHYTDTDGRMCFVVKAKNIAGSSASGYISVSLDFYKLPDTGQTLCYDEGGTEISCTGTGQDGEITTNPMSFTDNSNGTVTDEVTNLMWQKCSVGQTNDATCTGTASLYNRYEASGTYDATSNPDGTNVCGSLTLGGYSDWRLPSKNELISIVNYGTSSPAVDTTYFPNTGTAGNYGDYWSSTTTHSYVYYKGARCYVSFDDAYTNCDYVGSRAVRCVRGSSTVDNFTDNSDNTVTDHNTGLMWQQTDDGITKTWQDGLDYCNGLSLAGYSDWRLPDVKELVSISKTSNSSYDPAISWYFNNTKSSGYISSTTSINDPLSPWRVDFRFGTVFSVNRDKTNTMYVRCVR